MEPGFAGHGEGSAPLAMTSIELNLVPDHAPAALVEGWALLEGAAC